MESEDFWLFGRVVHRLGSDETARDCWTEGLRLDPNHPQLLREIVLDLIETGKPIQAARFAPKAYRGPGLAGTRRAPGGEGPGRGRRSAWSGRSWTHVGERLL